MLERFPLQTFPLMRWMYFSQRLQIAITILNNGTTRDNDDDRIFAVKKVLTFGKLKGKKYRQKGNLRIINTQ